MESSFLRVVDIESCQSNGSEDGQHEGQTGKHVNFEQDKRRHVGGAVHQPAHNEAWCHAKGDHVRQRVQFGADGGVRLEQACSTAVQEIEKACHENHNGSFKWHVLGQEQN